MGKGSTPLGATIVAVKERRTSIYYRYEFHHKTKDVKGGLYWKQYEASSRQIQSDWLTSPCLYATAAKEHLEFWFTEEGRKEFIRQGEKKVIETGLEPDWNLVELTREEITEYIVFSDKHQVCISKGIRQ